jgi:hypothetical protein
VSHPLAEVGRFVDDTPDACFALRHSYFGIQRVEDTVKRDDLTTTFPGWSYALEDHAIAFEGAGLCIEVIREPRPKGAPQRYERWRRVPMFLHV